MQSGQRKLGSVCSPKIWQISSKRLQSHMAVPLLCQEISEVLKLVCDPAQLLHQESFSKIVADVLVLHIKIARGRDVLTHERVL